MACIEINADRLRKRERPRPVGGELAYARQFAFSSRHRVLASGASLGFAEELTRSTAAKRRSKSMLNPP